MNIQSGAWARATAERSDEYGCHFYIQRENNLARNRAVFQECTLNVREVDGKWSSTIAEVLTLRMRKGREACV